MKNPLFTGCATALVTPFRDGNVDYPALENLIEKQIAGGVQALIAVGTTGEPATLSWEEHFAVIRFTVEKAAGRVPVIAGTGSNSTQEAIEATRFAKECGASGTLVVTPYYNRTSQQGLVAHFHAIADATDLPMIVYNVPSRTGMDIAPETLQQICRHPNICAVKEASANIAHLLEKIRLCGEDVTFYCGNDDLIVPMMACGCQGVISVLSNILPVETSNLCNLMLSGRMKEAASLQRKLLPLVNALFCETSPIPVKAAMAAMDLCQDELRLPLVPMQAGNRAKLYQIMQEDWGLMGCN